MDLGPYEVGGSQVQDHLQGVPEAVDRAVQCLAVLAALAAVHDHGCSLVVNGASQPFFRVRRPDMRERRFLVTVRRYVV